MNAEKKYICRFFVTKCENNSENASTKVFVSIPENPKRRKLWFSLDPRRDRRDIPTKSNFFCCQNH